MTRESGRLGKQKRVDVCILLRHGGVKLLSFTLIELLVVIAIIAILAAILLPTLQEARVRSYLAGCTGNQKTMAGFFAAYADAYDGYAPANAQENGSDAWFWWRLRTVIPGRGYNTDKIARKSTPSSSRDNSPYFYCPRIYKWQHKTNPTGNIFYCTVDVAKYYTTGNSAWYKIAKVPRPAEKFMLVEQAQGATGNVNARYYWISWNVMAHSEQSNVLHYDGHSETYSYGVYFWDTNLSASNKKRKAIDSRWNVMKQ